MKTSLILLIAIIKNTLSELRFVFELSRHGARAPYVDKTTKTDKLGNIWNNDNELTPIGIRMEYLLGYRNRLVYGNFLNETYSPSEIYVLSTDTNRTIASAYAQLQGLYPGSGVITASQQDVAVPPVVIEDVDTYKHMLGGKALNAQAIPIHIIGMDTKRFYIDYWGHCKPIGQLMIDNLNKQSIRDNAAEFTTKYGEKLLSIVGVNDTSYFNNHDHIWKISDAFYSGYIDGRSFDNLKTAGIDMKDFLKITNNTLVLNVLDYQFDDKDFFYGHFAFSPIHADILSWMTTRIKYDSEGKGYESYKAPKLVLLSGHDTNIIGIQAYMFAVFSGKFSKHFIYPDFSSSFYYELHKKDGTTTHEDKDYEVVVKMNDYIYGTIEFSDFKKNITELSYSQAEINNYCGYDNDDNKTPALHHMILLMSSVLLGSLIFIFVIVICCIKYRNMVIPIEDIPENKSSSNTRLLNI
jgi:hypothetical protein